MMASFNLLRDPWIPCVSLGGDEHELGIQDVCLLSQEHASIRGDSPIEAVAIMRLIIAILHRVFGPKSSKAWQKMWEQGQFSETKLKAYLKMVADKFDLFDSANPFYQVPSLDLEKYGSPTSRLCLELSSGNNATLFDHSHEDRPCALSPAEAARRLVTYQAFTPSGLVTYEKGKNEDKSADAGLLSNCAVITARGHNLFSTFMLNLAVYNPTDDLPIRSKTTDSPSWEQTQKTRAKDRKPLGYLDALTWQSRRIKLGWKESDTGIVVDRVAIMKGHQLPDNVSLYDCETMVAFLENTKAKPGQDPRPPLRFREARSLWRDSVALLQTIGQRGRAVKMLDHINDLLVQGYLPDSFVLSLAANGLCNARVGKIAFWRDESIPLPLSYLQEEAAVNALAIALQDSEKVASALHYAGSQIGAYATTGRAWSQLAGPSKNVARSCGDSIAVERCYWPKLNTAFDQLVIALAADKEEIDGQVVFGQATLPEWRSTIVRRARLAFGEAVSGLDQTARTLKAVAHGSRILSNGLSALENVWELRGGGA